jgi:hypothetical protein
MGGGRASGGGRNAAARTGGGGGGGPNTASGISYIKSGIAKQIGDVAVEVSVAKLNSGWKKNPINYIKGGDKNTTGSKYGQAKEFLAKNTTGVKMPEISVKNGVVTVRDGRHRTAVLRDTSKKTIFVTVKRSQAAEVKEKFGAK